MAGTAGGEAFGVRRLAAAFEKKLKRSKKGAITIH
jgi:hypothetical protein